MDTAEPKRFQFPDDFDASMAAVRTLSLRNFEFHPFTETVLDYAVSERVPNGFPRPEQHVVIADYLIDLPVVAVDLSPASDYYGRVLGYCYGDYWIIADSLSDFAARLQKEGQDAVYGR